MSLAPRPDAEPYAWAIEYPAQGGKVTLVSIIVHDDTNDQARAMQRAVDLHGVLVPLIADRRS